MQPTCLHCDSENPTSGNRSEVVCFGFFTRQSDGKTLQRFRCKRCAKTFSDASLSRCKNQNKRYLNAPLFTLLCSGVSQRRASRILKTNRKTVVRKLLFLATHAQALTLEANLTQPKAQTIEFDDLETFEHSKCKPLSVTMAVESGSRRILGYRVSQMPAKGHLAALSRLKYGPRKDHRPKARTELFADLTKLVASDALIKSDMDPGYTQVVRKYFPACRHQVFKIRRACVVGQGELKTGGFDPLFSINHSFAMLRANVNRIFRRTWNTTKLPERLSAHLALYVLYHNLVLVKYPST
jgi:transposase-like protein